MTLDISMVIYDNRNKKYFDVSNVVSDIKVYSYLTEQPGKCTFTIQKTDGLAFWEGATISLICNSMKVFKGFVFKKSRGMDVHTIDVTAYDQLRYLKNKDTRVFEGLTSSQIFSSICEDFVLKYQVVDSSTHICTARSNDNVALYEMIQNSLNDTLNNSGKWYIIRDNFGVLQHVNILSLNSGLILGDNSGITDLKYESSIDENVYNQIKLYRDNTTTKKRDVYIVNDTINGGQNLLRWGILQLYQKVDDNLNIAQIESKARGMLSLYNDTARTLTFDCIGDFHVFAGAIIKVQISDLGDITLNDYLLVNSCTHTLKNMEHTMSVEVELVRNG